MWHMHLVFEDVWLLMALMCTPYCLRIAGTHEHTVLASLAKRSRMLSTPTRTVRLYLSESGAWLWSHLGSSNTYGRRVVHVPR